MSLVVVSLIAWRDEGVASVCLLVHGPIAARWSVGGGRIEVASA